MQSCSWPEILARIEMGMWGAVREEGKSTRLSKQDWLETV